MILLELLFVVGSKSAFLFAHDMGGVIPSRLQAQSLCTERPRTLAAVAVGTFGLALWTWRRHRPLHLSTVCSSADSIEAAESPVVKATSSNSVVEEQTEKPDEISPGLLRWASCLIKAAADGKTPEVSQLLDDEPREESCPAFPCSADVQADLPSYPNVSAVFAAALNGRAEALAVLLSARADPNLKCQKATVWDGAFTLTERDTALVAAARSGHLQCVEQLLAARADPNVQCDSEYLEGAVEWGEDDDGTESMVYSALDAAHMSRQDEIAELIKRSGGCKIARPNTQRAPRKMISQGSRMGA